MSDVELDSVSKEGTQNISTVEEKYPQGSKGISIALYQSKIARFQQKYNLSMNMFMKKSNASNIRKAEPVIGDGLNQR